MAEPSGNISIDGVKLNQLGLHDVRGAVTVIPQVIKTRVYLMAFGHDRGK